MKIKKLLSIGALALVLATSTSIGAFAADRPTKEEVKADFEDLFDANESPLTYDVNQNTKIESVIDLEKLQDIIDKYDGDVDYKNLDAALTLINENDTLISGAIKISLSNDIVLNDLLTEIRSVADRLKEIENGTNTDNVNRIDFQKDMQELLNDDSLNLVFGKNKDGKATMAVMQESKIILQLNSGNVYTINDFLNSDDLTDYVQKIKDKLSGNE